MRGPNVRNTTTDTIKALAIELAGETLAICKGASGATWPATKDERSFWIQRLAAGERLYQALGRQVTGDEMDALRAAYIAATPSADTLARWLDGRAVVYGNIMDALPIGHLNAVAEHLGVPIPDPSYDDALKAKIERLSPMRVIVRFVDGKPHGVVEHSFSMGSDPERIRLFWSGKAYSIIGATTLDALSHAAGNTRPGDLVLDPLDPACPIRVDLKGWSRAKDKFGDRNPRFTVTDAAALVAMRSPFLAQQVSASAPARLAEHARR